LGAGGYNWMVNCTNAAGSKSSSETRHFDIILTTDFSGETTNVSTVNVSNIISFTLDKPGYGKIIFNESINLSNGSNINSAVNIQQNLALVKSALEPRLNKSATIYIYGLLYEFTPAILGDNQVCSDCTVLSYSQGNLSFSVPHFTNYTAAANSELFIWDDTDGDRRQPDETVNFYANYTNRTSKEAISGAGAWCEISFNDTGLINMTFNGTSELYTYQRSFSNPGYYYYTRI
jgi:hypothetical protein